MKYVYILQSVGSSGRYYVGMTDDLRSRMAKHNAGEVSHTSKYVPWELKTYVAFSDEARALAFEKYCQEATLNFRGCSSMVEQKPSKLMTRVRFPSPAPILSFSLAALIWPRVTLGVTINTNSCPEWSPA